MKGIGDVRLIVAYTDSVGQVVDENYKVDDELTEMVELQKHSLAREGFDVIGDEFLHIEPDNRRMESIYKSRFFKHILIFGRRHDTGEKES